LAWNKFHARFPGLSDIKPMLSVAVMDGKKMDGKNESIVLFKVIYFDTFLS